MANRKSGTILNLYDTFFFGNASNPSDKCKRRKKDANIIFWARLFSRAFMRVLYHLDQARSWGLRRGVRTDANIS